MTLRLMQAAALLVLAACGAAPTQSSAQQSSSGQPFRITEVTRFDAPWAMDFLPGRGVRVTNAALVTDKGGTLWLLEAGTGRKQQVTGVPAVKVAGQGGLGDVVAHPDFAGNQRIYLSYAEPGPNGTSGAALGYGRLILGRGQPRLEAFKAIWRQQPRVRGGEHYGHRIAFAPDGTLFLTSGDRFQFDAAQSLSGDLGKILHMTAEGRPVPANPWANRGGRAATYWTIGHRNPLGLAFSPDGRLWSTEMGPQGGDEFNLIVRAKNYGWPRVSYGSHYGGGSIPDDHRSRGFEEPKLWWRPSVSPGSLLIYTGDLFPEWRGDALIGALSGQAFIRVDIDGDQARKADQWDMGVRIRAVDQGPRGEVYLLVDGRSGGRVLRLEPSAR